MLQFPCGVQRVHVDQGEPGAHDGHDGNRVLHHVGHHHSDPVASGQSQPLQIHPEGLADFVDLRVGQLLAHETVRAAAGKLLEAFFHHVDNGRVAVDVNVGRYAFRVTL